MAGIKIRDVDGEFIHKVDALKDHVSEWEGLQAHVAMDLNRVVGVIITAKGRILHIYVEEESRRAGIGTMLIRYVINTHPKGMLPICAAVSFNNAAAQAMMLKAGMSWHGRTVLGDSEGWLFRAAEPPGNSDEFVARERALAAGSQKLIDTIFVMEVAPVVM